MKVHERQENHGNHSNPSRVRTWLQLFRAPNLFTVPGDPLAGYLMTNNGWVEWNLFFPIVASLCFYSAGLVMNDLADEAEDRRDRPKRPIPSGQVSRVSVIAVTIALCVLGMLALVATHDAAAIKAGVVLIGAIALYNFLTKHWPVIGALNMGACRGLSVMLGAFVGPQAAFGFKLATIPALIIGLYIAAVTNLARHETKDGTPVLARLLPLAAGLFGCFGSIRYALTGPALTPAIALFCFVAGWLVWLTVQLFKNGGRPLPPLIGAHIRVLLPLQAAICFLGNPYPWEAGTYAAILLLAAWPVSWAVSKRFYAS
jgi:4-hydroxybenzoate polyprenyltransferase